MSWHRLGSLTIAAGFVLAVIMTWTPSVKAADPQPLLPDLGMAPLEDFKVERRGTGVTWLRFSTIIVNVGDGPFEVYGYPAAGDSTERRSDVEQRIFNADGSHSDTQTPAYMFWSGDGHNHWHVFGFQRWELANVNTPADVLATGKKTGFCFWDNYLYGSSHGAWYHPSVTDACDPTTVVSMGLSTGWGDEYPAGLTDQYIDISGLPQGEYLLTVTADPLGEFIETDATNNVVRALIRIDRNSVEVIGQEGYVQPLSSTTDNPPSVTVTQPADGATVSGSVAVSADAFDDHGVASVDFSLDGVSIGTDTDGSNGWSFPWDTTTSADGAHQLSATATDTGGQPASHAIDVTVANSTGGGGGSAAVHVGDLDASSTSQGSRWTANVSITVHDTAHAAVADAVVSGTWTLSSGSVTDSCITGPAGTCAVSTGGMHKREASVTFTVTGISSSAGAYGPGDNHDPDGDSDGTSIRVAKP